MVNMLVMDLVLFVELTIIELIVVKINPPVPRWYLTGMLVIREKDHPSY